MCQSFHPDDVLRQTAHAPACAAKIAFRASAVTPNCAKRGEWDAQARALRMVVASHHVSGQEYGVPGDSPRLICW